MTKVIARSIHRTMREQHGVNETTVAAAVMPRALLAIRVPRRRRLSSPH